MSFVLNAEVRNAEYRGKRSGMTKGDNPRPWISLVFEDSDINTLEVSVPAELQGEISDWGLERGSHYRVPVSAVATQSYNYVRLSGAPALLTADPDTGEVY